MQQEDGSDRSVSRREFVKQSAVAAASFVTASGLSSRAYAAGSDEVKVGLIGCGGRGTGATTQALMATKTPVKLWAMADLFRDQLDRSYDMLYNGAEARYDRVAFDGLASQMDVPEERKFVGFDAYRRLLDSGVDMVILATPPGFRPMQFRAAVEAGKHVFLEKPVAVDPAGIRTVIAAAKVAKDKGLSVVAGTQRRHQNHYIEIMKRVHDGAIGEIRAAQCYWNGSGGSLRQTKPAGMSDMEWQVRHWYYFCWLSGDHIVEQHVHNIDIMNWAFQGHPEFVMGMGGRAVREGGNIWDHFAVEFEYPGGVRVRLHGPRVRAPRRDPGDRLYRQQHRLDPGPQPVRAAGLAQPVRAGARRPDRQHPQWKRTQRGRPGGREYHGGDHRQDERLYRPGDEVGLGDEPVQVGPEPAEV
jgi:myo-inositol 2-dehydrogenase/D-chiro-inositol 1-dehydrogenase